MPAAKGTGHLCRGNGSGSAAVMPRALWISQVDPFVKAPRRQATHDPWLPHCLNPIVKCSYLPILWA